MYDIIIIGAGPAGLTAALYALRADKKVLILEKETFGGQITFSPKIENYPGTLQMSGNEFADKFIGQVLEHGAQIELEEVLSIKNKGNVKIVSTNENEYEGKSVILATGSKHRQLGLPNENELIGEGVSYCAVCDGPFYNGQTVAVIGGGNTALQEAVLLSDYCKKVYVVQNLDFLTGESKLIQKLQNKENVEIILGNVVKELIGKEKLSSILIENTTTKQTQNVKLDGIFVAIGQIPENEAFSSLVNLNEYGYILSDETCLTNAEGIFAAGDCRTKTIRQITTALADGAVAAVTACRYIESQDFKE